MTSGGPFDYNWDKLQDSTLRPALIVIETPTGFRPALSADFGGGGGSGSTINVSGLNVTTVPTVPASQGTYAVSIDGGLSFSNYTTQVPNVTGIVTLSLEPDSSNVDATYYAFSASDTSGTAWELRGPVSFEVSGLRTVYFGAVQASDRVRAHYQKY